MGLLFLMIMEYNTYMLAYDVPLSALLFILWAGVPVEEYIKGPSQEETLAYIEKLRKIQESENDGL
jgi:hypothetical protein